MAKRYKWLAGDRPVYGSGSYDLGGAWQSVEGPLVLFEQGYHVCSRKQVSRWRGTSLWEVEVDGERLGDDAKECWRKIRFVRQLKWTQRDMLECAARDADAAREAASRAANASAASADAWVAATAASWAVEASAAAARAVTNAAASAYADAWAADTAASYAAEASAAAARAVTNAAASAYAATADDAATAANAAADANANVAYAAAAERKRQTAWIEGRLGETLG